MSPCRLYRLEQPGVHDGVDQDVCLDDASRLGRLAQQAQQVVLPVLGAHLVLVEEGVDLGEIHLGKWRSELFKFRICWVTHQNGSNLQLTLF